MTGDCDRPASLQQRAAAVKRKLPIAGVVEGHVKLSGTAQSRNRRGPCPFHGSSSASFSIKTTGRCEDGFAHCFGCQWSGDVVGFVKDILGVDFKTALEHCEGLAGISVSTSLDTNGRASVGTTASGYLSADSGQGPVKREKIPSPRRQAVRESIEAIDMARWLWSHARPDLGAVRRYFVGRGIPAAVLTDARMRPFRYLSQCPCWQWKQGEDPRRAKGMMLAPALIAMVRVPTLVSDPLASTSGCEALPQAEPVGPRLDFVPVGLHVTYLNPAGDGTMVRRKPWAKPGDPDALLPKRRMLGPVGRGAILLGDYHPGAHLFVGEGNETVLSAMALAGAGDARAQVAGGGSADDIVGVATLSLDNLQGAVSKWRNGAWPLHAIKPDPERGPFVIPDHIGAVTALIDADMSPLRGMRDRVSGDFLGEAVVERKNGPIVRRAITGAERAAICADLVVQGWRAVGAHSVRAIRPPANMDFNDLAARSSQLAGHGETAV